MMIISVSKEMIGETIMAYCPKCGVGTVYTLDMNKKFYTCSCGYNSIKVELEDENE